MLKTSTLTAALLTSALALSGAAMAQDSDAQEMSATPNDLLNATLWMQSAVEYKANALAVYELARLKLDEALADDDASALDQDDAADLPPAVIIDADETAIDNSAYEAGLVTTDTDYSSSTWAEWTAAEEARAVPGAVEYAQYADSKGVKVFYVTNRKAAEEEATRNNMEALGFPMGGNVDTFLTRGEREEWTSDKTSRRDVVAQDYRVLALIGDNLGDFVEVENDLDARDAAFQEIKSHFTKDWFMLANPTYGSWESSLYGGDYSLSRDEKRAMKYEALDAWEPSAQ